MTITATASLRTPTAGLRRRTRWGTRLAQSVSVIMLVATALSGQALTRSNGPTNHQREDDVPSVRSPRRCQGVSARVGAVDGVLRVRPVRRCR